MKHKRIGCYRVLDQRLSIYAAEDIIVDGKIIYERGSAIREHGFIVKRGCLKVTALPIGNYFIKYAPFKKIHLTYIR